MKGQYLTLENIFFFAIGVVMVIGVYSAFSSISDSMRSAALQEQLAKEGESIRASVAKVFMAGNSTNSTISASMEIPRQLSGCEYKIASADGKLYVSCTDGRADAVSLNLYGIETRVKNNAAYSSSGWLNILYANGGVIIS